MKNINKQNRPIYRPENSTTHYNFHPYQQNLIIPSQSLPLTTTIIKEITVKNPIVYQPDQLLKVSTCNINNNLKISNNIPSEQKIKTRTCPVNFKPIHLKYSHILNGKINPEHKTTSSKPEEEKRQKHYNDELTKMTVFGNKLKISNTHEQIIKVPYIQPNLFQAHQQLLQTYSTQRKRPFSSMVNRDIVIGESKCNNIQSNTHKTFVDQGTSTEEFMIKESVDKGKNSDKGKCVSTINSKQARDALKKSEKYFAAIDNFIVSSEKKIPSKQTIDELVEFGKIFEQTLQKLKS